MLKAWTSPLILVLCVTAVGVFLWRAVILGSSSQLNSSFEAMSLSGALRLSEGKPLYPPVTQEQAWVYHYQPLHAWLSAGLLRIFDRTTLSDRVCIIRAFSLFCFLILLGAWGVWLKQMGYRVLILALSILLSLSRFSDYFLVGRNDMLYVLLEFAALLCSFQWLQNKKRPFLIFCILFSTLAFFTRQIPSAVLIGLCAYLFQKRNWNALAHVSLGTLTLLLVTGGLFFMHTQGSVSTHLFSFSFLNFKDPPINQSLVLFLMSYAVFFGFSLPELFKKQEIPQLLLLKYVALFGLFFSTLGYLRQWSDTNFFLFPIVVLSPFFARSISLHFSQPVTHVFIMAQIVFCILLYTAKAISVVGAPTLDYPAVAEIIRQRYPKGGYVTGPLNGTLILHLSDWSKNGPDVASFLWPAISSKHLPDLPGTLWVNAGPNAKADALQRRGVFSGYKPLECVLDWVCVYRL